jgi:acyl-coenzyme A synthetase/AMP-(fatty) acid ligase
MTAGATSGDRFRSWPDIQANAARAAGGLRALGVVEDDSVALMLRNDFATFEVNMVAGQLGAMPCRSTGISRLRRLSDDRLVGTDDQRVLRRHRDWHRGLAQLGRGTKEARHRGPRG